MSAEENKSIVRRVIEEVYNQGRLDLVDDLIAPTFVTTPLWPDPRRPRSIATMDGPEGFKAGLAMLRAAMPDVHLTIEALMADGDAVMTCSTMRGTHTGGPYLDIPARGAVLRCTSFSIYRLAEGKIVEQRWLWDRLGAFQQLGVLPSQEALQQQLRAVHA